ncbi:unnamed protein product [Discula destructiva]
MQLAAALPACGLDCVETSLATSECTEVSCMCSNAALQKVVTVCVMANCSIIDQLTTKNVTNTACGVAPRNAGPAYNVVSIVMGSISGAVLLLRIGYRLFIAQSMPTMDDWCIIGCILVGSSGTAMTSLGTIKNGLGQDVWTLTPQQITSFAYWFYFMEWTYFLELCFLKMSLLFFYLKIFPAKGVRMLLWGTIAYNAAWGISFVVVALFQCRPISYMWTNWDGTGSGTCLNSNAIGWANGITSIVLDVWMLAIPMAQLRTLQLHFKKKVGVAIMFFTGTFVTVISIVRLQALTSFGSSSNPTWDNLKVSQWSTIEVNVGIICASMPTMRLLLLRIFPSIFGSTQGYGGYKASRSWGDKSTGPRSRGAGYVDVTCSAGSGARPTRPGITYQRSYAVHYQDEPLTSSQVQLNVLDPKGFEPKHHVTEFPA